MSRRGLGGDVWVCLVLAAVLSAAAGPGWAFNETAVLTGNDAAMTGGVVTATTRSGSAIWYNPAGVWDIEARSLDFAGSVFVWTLYNVDDILSAQRAGNVDADFDNFVVMPRALTYVSSLKLFGARVAMGLFQSHYRGMHAQEQLSKTEESPPLEWVADLTDEREALHGALALAWRLGDTVTAGISVDLVWSRWSRSLLVTGANSDPDSSSASGVTGLAENFWSGGVGMQLRGGVQWRFAPQWQLGFALSTPSYLVAALQEITRTGVAANQSNPGTYQAQVSSGIKWGLFGIEPAIGRVGLGYFWGNNWLALDVVTAFPLEESLTGIDRKFATNVKLGSIFHVAEKVKLGLSVITDRSPEREPRRFGDVQADLYGVHVGIDFANLPAPVSQGEGAYLSVSLSGRYAFGRGQFGALQVADTVGDPDYGIVIEPSPVTIHEVVLHVSAKAMF